MLAGFLVALLVFGGVAYAVPPLARVGVSASAETSTVADDANVKIRMSVGGPHARVPGDLHAAVRRRLRKLTPDVNVERYVRRALARRAEIKKIIAREGEIKEAHLALSRACFRINRAIVETARRFRLVQREWMKVRQQFLAGEVDEATYFEKTKDFVLTAIDLTIERLGSIASVVGDETVASRIEERIAELEQLRSEVEAAGSLEELRALYPEVRRRVLSVQKRAVFRHYARMTIGLGRSIAARLDVAAARLAAIVDELKARGAYDENVDSAVTAIFAKIDAIKDEFNTLQSQLESGEIDIHGFLQELAKIREEIRGVYAEIRDLHVQLMGAHTGSGVRTRHRVRVKINAPGKAGTIRTDVNVSTGVGTEEESVEQRPRAERRWRGG